MRRAVSSFLSWNSTLPAGDGVERTLATVAVTRTSRWTSCAWAAAARATAFSDTSTRRSFMGFIATSTAFHAYMVDRPEGSLGPEELAGVYARVSRRARLRRGGGRGKVC